MYGSSWKHETLANAKKKKKVGKIWIVYTITDMVSASPVHTI